MTNCTISTYCVAIWRMYSAFPAFVSIPYKTAIHQSKIFISARIAVQFVFFLHWSCFTAVTHSSLNAASYTQLLYTFSHFHSCHLTAGRMQLLQTNNMLFLNTLGHLTFWISLSLRPKTETKRLNFGLSWSSVQPITAARHRWHHRWLIADFVVFLCLFLN